MSKSQDRCVSVPPIANQWSYITSEKRNWLIKRIGNRWMMYGEEFESASCLISEAVKAVRFSWHVQERMGLLLEMKTKKRQWAREPGNKWTTSFDYSRSSNVPVWSGVGVFRLRDGRWSRTSLEMSPDDRASQTASADEVLFIVLWLSRSHRNLRMKVNTRRFPSEWLIFGSKPKTDSQTLIPNPGVWTERLSHWAPVGYQEIK